MNNPVILITGALTGIGRATAIAFAQEGARIVDAVVVASGGSGDIIPVLELVALEGVQVAGRHCAATEKTIAFERDARLCPNCAQVYLKDNVPKTCVTCERDLGSAAIEL